MPRALRIQYPGARYHVINRGNYRSDIFESKGASSAFLKALAEVVQQYGWKLHAYVLMRNHYHLAIETPKANLVDGMHWLQSTFSTRFNRFRNQRGHVFQGRYKSNMKGVRALFVDLACWVRGVIQGLSHAACLTHPISRSSLSRDQPGQLSQ